MRGLSRPEPAARGYPPCASGGLQTRPNDDRGANDPPWFFARGRARPVAYSQLGPQTVASGAQGDVRVLRYASPANGRLGPFCSRAGPSAFANKKNAAPPAPTCAGAALSLGIGVSSLLGQGEDGRHDYRLTRGPICAFIAPTAHAIAYAASVCTRETSSRDSSSHCKDFIQPKKVCERALRGYKNHSFPLSFSSSSAINARRAPIHPPERRHQGP